MVAIIVAEFAATARPSIRVFQTLLAGKTGQNGAPGRVGAVPTAFETRRPGVWTPPGPVGARTASRLATTTFARHGSVPAWSSWALVRPS